jgi:hypothetical protein
MKTGWVIAILLGLLTGYSTQAKSYSSGGHSYSSGSHSSYSSGGSSGSSRSGGSSYSSGSKGYSSGSKSYSSGGGGSSSSSSGKTYSSGSSGGGITQYHPQRDSSDTASQSPRSYSAPRNSAGSFDSAAARAKQRDESTRRYSSWKGTDTSTSSGGGGVPGVPPTASSPNYYDNSARPRGYTARTTTYYPYVPSYDNYATHHTRIINYYGPYMGRPVVLYHDPYSSWFWWWLLDQSLDTRAQWAYNHRYAMDAARYDALMADANLAARVRQLEQSQSRVDPNFAPAGMQRDLMYNERYVQNAYRGTTRSRILFWVFMPPIALGVTGFTVWLLFFKKWNVK